MESQEIGFEGVLLITANHSIDVRGSACKPYDKKFFSQVGIDTDFVEDFFSMSNKDVIRGLHFQNKPVERAKLVKVLQGKIWDVIVDIRKDSKTYGKWFSIELAEGDGKALFIPKGFAHGFLALEDKTIVWYKFSNYYSKEGEGGIRWDDSDIAIPWNVSQPIISERDKSFPTLKELS